MKDLYIITGAAGHLGNTLIRRLLKEDCMIRGLILASEKKEFPERVEYFTGDVTDPSSLEPLFNNIDGYCKISGRG